MTYDFSESVTPTDLREPSFSHPPSLNSILTLSLYFLPPSSILISLVEKNRKRDFGGERRMEDEWVMVVRITKSWWWVERARILSCNWEEKSLKIYKRIEMREEEKRITQEICFGSRIGLFSRPLLPSYFLLFLTRNSFTLTLLSAIDNSLMEREISLKKENEIFGFKGREWWRLKVPYCLFLGSFQTFPGIRRDALFPISRKLTAFSFPFCSCECFDSTHIQFERSKKRVRKEWEGSKNEEVGVNGKGKRVRKATASFFIQLTFCAGLISTWKNSCKYSFHFILELINSLQSRSFFLPLTHSSNFFARVVLLFFRSHPFLFLSLVQRKMNDSALT